MMNTDYNSIVLVKFGSHLYGTSTPESDQDFKAVYIPEAKDILLGRVKPAIHSKTKYERTAPIAGVIEKNNPDDIDIEVISLDFFFKRLSEGDPMVIDMLFAIDVNLMQTSPIWEQIRDNRHKLVSKDITKSVEYCKKQAAKYGIKGSRVGECRRLRGLFEKIAESNPKAKVRDVGEYLKTLIIGWEKTHIEKILQANGMELEHLVCVDKKIPFTITVGEAFKILDIQFQKYGQRSLAAEQSEGVDWKALSHAVRVGFQTIENNIDLAKEAMKNSILPENVDKVWIEDFICRYYGCAVLEMQL